MKHFNSSPVAVRWLLLWFVLPFFGFAAPVDRTITGTVRDAETHEPLIGCTILVKGNTNGTTTGPAGKYSIRVPDNNAVLVFQFVGFTTTEVPVGNRSEIDIELKSDVAQLSQVVVIGYGSTAKKDMTGSVSSIKAAEFNQGIINSPEQLLQGKVSGVNVVSATGEPGGQQNITVRGPGGIRTGSTPLFVVDGLPLDNSSTGGNMNPLTFLNPSDIESIDVLKDASATAIYGARGANGVVLITTKKGKSGHSSVTYNGSIGISTMARPLDVLSADQFRQEVPKLGGTLIDKGGNTDWQKVISRTAYTQTHNIALSGGSDKLTYYGSFGIQSQEGILKKNDLKRYTGRINVNQKLLNDRVSVDVNLNASNTRNLRPPIQSLIGGAITANPTYPAYDDKGDPYQYTDGTNPLIPLALEKDLTTTTRIIGNISPSVTIIKGLVYRLNFGIDQSTSQQDLQSLPNAVPFQEGRLATINTYNTNRLIENYVTYSFDRNKHTFSALAGHSYQRIFLQGRSYSINKFNVTDVEPIYNPGLGQDLTLVNNRPTGYATVNELQSFFSRVNYQFADKYLVTATVRVDGSSKFGSNNKYGVFPSASLGWRMSEEPFLKPITQITELKLRAGWGQTGNQEIPSKITQALFTNSVTGTTSYPLTATGNYPSGTIYTRLANPNIQWEVSSQTDLGIDFAFFDGSLSGSFDWFRKVSSEILLEVIPSDPVQPAGTFWTNVHNMTITNRGAELDLAYRKTFKSGFRFSLGGNITFIKNKVMNSPYTVITSGSAQGSGLTSATINGYVNGQPIGTFFLKEFIGFDDKGNSKFRDTDGDGIVTDKDRIAAGTALPKQMFNINGSVGYKGFDLSVNFNGVSGNKLYDNTANSNFYKLKLSKGVNVTPEAIASSQESVNNAAPVSTRYLKDGSFLRLNNAVLGYTFNTTAMGIAKWVPTLRVSVTGQNLFVITKYNGYDPEVNNDRSVSGISSYGIDYLSYPKARTFVFGVTIGL